MSNSRVSDYLLTTIQYADRAAAPRELPEDPIQQIEISVTNSSYNKYGKKSHSTKMNVRLGLGSIDKSMFRIPKSQPHSGPSSHSDGFEGKEANPIGRFMPIKIKARQQTSCPKLTFRMGELKLVADLPAFDSQEQSRSRKQKPKRSKTPDDAEHVEALKDDDGMIIDAEEQVVPVDLAAKGRSPILGIQAVESNVQPSRPQSTPSAQANDTSILEPATRSSPLQQKEQRVRKASLEGSQADSTQFRGPLGRRRDENEMGVSQQMKMARAPDVEISNRESETLSVDVQVSTLSILSSLQ